MYSVQDALDVNEMIERSTSLCPPGPHAFLMVIPVETLRERQWIVEALLELLQERVWRHTVVLFTIEESLRGTTIEQHIERERCLRQIVEKCGNRYHVLNTTDRAGGTQVTELLEKIEEMVAGNSGAYFIMDGAFRKELEEKRRAAEERGEQRLMKVQKQRETLRALLMGESDRSLSELRIVLLGSRCAGLSSSGNTILGREEFDRETHYRVCEETGCSSREAGHCGRHTWVGWEV
ncbi:hypothetical protein AAFF_G00190780 [Aldrovandia affinis]|uniref:AIG1-type G domain-containing protein n=1 Tax=Aldrovandia affinis TaxID=143900 RepID=A0AAD7W736_9TELE|nr:hypothetical protein AAFF_G00190780 [Aldrovandia affinis]